MSPDDEAFFSNPLRKQLPKGDVLAQDQFDSSCLSLRLHLRGSGSLPGDLPAAVQPPDGRFLCNADIDKLRQAVFPVQEVRVL